METGNNSVEHRYFEKRADEFGGQLNLDREFDWPPAVGHERWDKYECETSLQIKK